MSRWTVARDAVAAGDLTQALPLATLAVDGFPVNLDGLPSDVPAFDAGAPPVYSAVLNSITTGAIVGVVRPVGFNWPVSELISNCAMLSPVWFST